MNELIERIQKNVGKVIVGKDSVITNIIKGIICEGHILIEDLPGMGKTTLVKAMAKTMDLSFSRIQFTPDLLPSDITGVSIYNPKEMNFEFRQGPVFANIILADEINRTSPKTQAALLEVMEESQVSEGNTSYQLEKPFVVLATQNPIEYEGTFNLPEAQLDRFIMKMSIGYPAKEDEMDILRNFRADNPLDDLRSTVSKQDVMALIQMVRQVKVSDAINDYIVRLSNETRNSHLIAMGVSPRASLALMKLSQAEALISGRDYVIPDDVKANVVLSFSHRIKLSGAARAKELKEKDAIRQVLEFVRAPR